MTYSDIDTDLRIKHFDFVRCDNSIKKIEERVKMCRKYINSLMNITGE